MILSNENKQFADSGLLTQCATEAHCFPPAGSMSANGNLRASQSVSYPTNTNTHSHNHIHTLIHTYKQTDKLLVFPSILQCIMGRKYKHNIS